MRQVTFNGGTPTKVTFWQEDMHLTHDILVMLKIGRSSEPIIRIDNNNKPYRLVSREAFASHIQDAIKKAIPKFDKIPVWGKAQADKAKIRGQQWSSKQVNESKADYYNLKGN